MAPHSLFMLPVFALFGLAEMDNIGQDCASTDVAWKGNGRLQIFVAKWVKYCVVIISYTIWAFTQKVIIS
jgi:hypothetical protein